MCHAPYAKTSARPGPEDDLAKMWPDAVAAVAEAEATDAIGRSMRAAYVYNGATNAGFYKGTLSAYRCARTQAWYTLHQRKCLLSECRVCA